MQIPLKPSGLTSGLTGTSTAGQRRRALRRLLATGAAIGATLLTPAVATAGGPVSDGAQVAVLSECQPVETPLGAALVQVFLLPTARGEVAVVTGPAEEPVFVAATDETFSATWNGSRATGSGDLVDPVSGEPVGLAGYDLTVTAGDEVTKRWHTRDGNQMTQNTLHTRQLSASGILTLNGYTYELTCTGLQFMSDLRATQPDSDVDRSTFGTISCDAVGSQGSRLIMAGDGFEINLYVVNPDESLAYWGFAHDDYLRLVTRTGVTTTFNLHDGATGERIGDLEVNAPARATSPTRSFGQDGTSRWSLTTSQLDYDGVLTLPTGESFALDGCEGIYEVATRQTRNPA
jgi:hypothetical protein